jgi:hypothetical protein
MIMERCDLMKTSCKRLASLLYIISWKRSSSMGDLRSVSFPSTQLWMLFYSKHRYFVVGIGFSGVLALNKEWMKRYSKIIGAYDKVASLIFENDAELRDFETSLRERERESMRAHGYVLRNAGCICFCLNGLVCHGTAIDPCHPHWKCNVNNNVTV